MATLLFGPALGL